MKHVAFSRLEGTAAAPPSKSLTQRAAAVAFLCRGETKILNASLCDDAGHAFRLIADMGATVDYSGAGRGEKRIGVRGGGPPGRPG
jgi:5-enolpyruvylshikimate-3-phosphate synthase